MILFFCHEIFCLLLAFSATTEADMSAPSKWVVICCPVAGKKTGKAVTTDEFLPKMKEVAPDVPVDVIYTQHKVRRRSTGRREGIGDLPLYSSFYVYFRSVPI